MTGLRSALRIARRDARRARGRSVLIAAMIALPVLGLTAADVLVRTGQLDPDEQVTYTLGAAQARLEQTGIGKVLQAPDPGQGIAGPGDGSGDGSPRPLRSLVPSGFRVLGERSGVVQARTRSGLGSVGWSEVAAGDRAFRGRFDVSEGRLPQRRDEVAVTPRLLERLGATVGGKVRLTQPARTVRVIGVAEERLTPSLEIFYAKPGALGSRHLEDRERLYLVGSRSLSWDDVLAFNERGVVVYSREVQLRPPPRERVPFYAQAGPGSGPEPLLYIGLALVAALATLEVVLLAGAAFAVGARRQARSLALVAASGGEQRQLQAIVLSSGLVLGVAGATAGVAGGIAVAAMAAPALSHFSGSPIGRFDVRPLEIAAVWLAGGLIGVLAAALPARLAARQDPLQVITGRRGVVRTPRKAPVVGVLVACVGLACSTVGSLVALSDSLGINPVGGGRSSLAAGLIAGGAVLLQLGLIACCPAIIGALGRRAGRLPLASRLAMRDAARHRGRSAPAMAAVLTAVAASTALALFITAIDDRDRRNYQPMWPERMAGASLVTYEDRGANDPPRPVTLDARRIQSVLTPHLPPMVATVVEVDSSATCTESCRTVEPLAAAGPPGGSEAPAYWGGAPVGGASVLRATTGTSSAAAAERLASGGVVVTDRRYLDGGRVAFRIVEVDEQRRAIADGGTPRVRTVRLPGTYLAAPGATPPLVYGPGAARRLGIRTVPGTLAMRFDGDLPTVDQEDAAVAALADAGINTMFSLERGYRSDYGIGLLALALGAALITLGAAGISTGLAQADARDDHATLAAIGAAPGARKRLAAAQTLSIAGLGTMLGILSGFVPAIAMVGAVESLELVVPWGRLAAGAIGVPLLAAAVAWALTRARLPLRRRIA